MAGKDILAIGPIKIAPSESLFSGAPVFYQDGRLRVTERTPVERAFDLFSPYERSDSATVDGFFSGSDSFSGIVGRSEEHTSEIQSLMRISYAVFCLKKKQ